MILNAPWLTAKPRKHYHRPAVRSQEVSLEIRATREWKIFYSRPRKQEHDRIYDCHNGKG